MSALYALVRRLRGLPDGRLMTLDGHCEGSGHNDGLGHGGLVVYGDGEMGNGCGGDLSLPFCDGFALYGASGTGFGSGYGYRFGDGESK